MVRNLIVIGVHKSKLSKINSKDVKKLMTFIDAAYDNKFMSVTAIVQTKVNEDGYMNRLASDECLELNEGLPYRTDQILTVPGYDVDSKIFNPGQEYYICGLYTSAQIITVAMSLYSVGLNVKVLTNMCFDKDDTLHKEALDIMRVQMPRCLIEV